MADDSLADPNALTRALPVPAARRAMLNADTLAPAEIAAALRFAEGRQGGKHKPRLRRRLGGFRPLGGVSWPQPPALPARPAVRLPRRAGRFRLATHKRAS